uniref:Uncharacterized protein n=1 Tax=Trichogramma kaykai TaxID=54128 RepID=A0ABD2X919_9HYME
MQQEQRLHTRDVVVVVIALSLLKLVVAIGIYGGRDLFLFPPIVRRESRECSTTIRTPQCSARCAAEPRGVGENRQGHGKSRLDMPLNIQVSTVGRSSTANDKRKEDKSIEISRQSLVTPPPLAFYLQSMVSEFPPLDA